MLETDEESVAAAVTSVLWKMVALKEIARETAVSAAAAGDGARTTDGDLPGRQAASYNACVPKLNGTGMLVGVHEGLCR